MSVFCANLTLKELVYEYIDKSGNFDSVPKRGEKFTTIYGDLKIIEAQPLTKYTDGGVTPFTVRVRCHAPQTYEINYGGR